MREYKLNRTQLVTLLKYMISTGAIIYASDPFQTTEDLKKQYTQEVDRVLTQVLKSDPLSNEEQF